MSKKTNTQDSDTLRAEGESIRAMPVKWRLSALEGDVKTINTIQRAERALGGLAATLERSEYQSDEHPLVGRWFHSFGADNVVEWQGEVVARVCEDVFLVQLHEWLMGARGDQRLVSLSKMLNWAFYESAEDMSSAYNTKLKYRERKAVPAPVLLTTLAAMSDDELSALKVKAEAAQAFIDEIEDGDGV